MKQAYFIILLITLAAIVSNSCTKYSNNMDNGLKEYTLIAQSPDYGDKTIHQSDGKILWSPSDSISVFYGQGSNGGSKFTSTNTEPAARATFKGTIDAISGGIENGQKHTCFWGVYPYSEYTSCNGNCVTIKLPSIQMSGAGTFSRGQFPTMGRSEGLTMGFYNICGGIKFTVTKNNIKSITFKAKDNTALAGILDVSFGNDGKPTITNISDGSNRVTIFPEEGNTFIAGETYYAVMAPGTLKQGIDVTFSTDTQEATYSNTNSIQINRSLFKTLTDKDQGLTWSSNQSRITFADANFEKFCVRQYDTNGDGAVSTQEAMVPEEMVICTDSIISLKGINYFRNLKSLDVEGSGGICFIGPYPSYGGDCKDIEPVEGKIINKGKLTSIDLSGLTKLETLSIKYNSITKINLDSLHTLRSFVIWQSELKSLNLNECENLTYLDCRYNCLSNLDISKNSSLKKLYCSNNLFTDIDISNNLQIDSLFCEVNKLTSLDVSNNTALKLIWCHENQLSNLDISKNTSLVEFSCYSNQLANINISGASSLRFLFCENNQLTTIDISNNISLESLYCNNNLLSSLNCGYNNPLKELLCEGNKFITLNAESLPALQSLRCSNNQMTDLNVRNNANLVGLYCGNNKLSTLDVSKNTSLLNLRCESNQLGTIDISGNVNLQQLYCYNNKITELNIDNNPALSRLYCYDNEITNLDVSKDSALVYLYCYNNKLTSLKLGNNPLLRTMNCYGNLLKTLDVSKSNALRTLDCAPMNDSEGNNLLSTLYISEGQTISRITSNRNANYIPQGTTITISPQKAAVTN